MLVLLGWGGTLPCAMSVQLGFPGFEGPSPQQRLTAGAARAGIGRELRYLLTRSAEAGGGFGISPSGLAHSVGVCLIKDFDMSRGKGKQSAGQGGSSLPTFVDVKLSAEERESFLSWSAGDVDPVKCLQAFADEGYRVGVAWSGEHQTYTVSVTCRDTGSENNGLCMTSFGRVLPVAVMLAWYKHEVITERVWRAYEPDAAESFG